MKLKKTLSMLIGGICLVAATTAALAYPVCRCVICDGDVTGFYSTTYNVNGSHTVRDPKKHYSYICYYTDKYRKDGFSCSGCGGDYSITTLVKHNLNHK